MESLRAENVLSIFTDLESGVGPGTTLTVSE